ncbi:MAG: LPS export ABC transporter periplasmic protein LptC, partial [Chlorobiales bacterium]|nr:LPS export ABC transporter periplasmic protein LptC [Chlorobiales bacterium]
VTSTDSTVLRTEQMKWSNDDQKIRSDQFVTITKPTETLRGYGFESDQSMKNYRIFKVSGEAKIKEKPSSTSQ